MSPIELRQPIRVIVGRDRATIVIALVGIAVAIGSVLVSYKIYKTARELEAESFFDSAGEQIAKALESSPEDRVDQVMLRSASLDLKYATQRKKKDPRGLLYEGVIELYDGRLDRAIELLMKSNDEARGAARDASMFLALAYDVSGDLDGARKYFEAALTGQRGYLRVCPFLAYGNFLYDRDELEAAKEAYRSAENCLGVRALARANLANILASQGKYQEALSEIEYAVRSDRENPSFLWTLGASLFGLGDFRQAEIVFRSALNGSSSDIRTYEMLSVAIFAQGRTTEAAELRDPRLRLIDFLNLPDDDVY